MHTIFPNLLGFGLVYDTLNHSDAYQMNPTKKPERGWKVWQDSIYHSLVARLDQDKFARKRKLSCSVIRGNSTKRHKATQVS